MKLEEAMLFVQQKIEVGLATFFIQKRSKASNIHPESLQIVDAVCDFTLGGGKRIRPWLCWLGFQTVHSSPLTVHSKQIAPSLLQAMVGIELLQSFALIHDDIIDEDATRRGKPTVHEKFKRVHREQFTVNSKLHHFGESMAILAGDLALAWADECMEQVGERKVITLFSKTKQEMILGQSLDVLREQAGTSIEKKLIDTYKTAYYTIVRPLQMGVLLGDGTEKQLKNMEFIGVQLGSAFQLRDDFLDGDLTKKDFDVQSALFIARSMQTLASLDVPEKVMQLFGEFTQFVVSRQS